MNDVIGTKIVFEDIWYSKTTVVTFMHETKHIILVK